MLMLRLAAFCLIAVATPAVAYGQIASAAPAPRDFPPQSMRCEYLVGVFANWDDRVPATKLDNETFELVFEDIDVEAGKARLMINGAAWDVDVVRGSGMVTFLDITSSRNVVLTSVFEELRQGLGLASVFSEHVGSEGKPSFVWQYYGWCKPLD